MRESNISRISNHLAWSAWWPFLTPKNFLWPSQNNFHTRTDAGHLQGLNAGTSWRGFQQDLHKIFSQGPVRDHDRKSRRFHQDLETRTSHQDHKILQRPQRPLTAISTRASHKGLTKNLDQDPHARTPKRSSQDAHKRTFCCLLERILQGLDTWKPPKSLPQELSCKHL